MNLGLDVHARVLRRTRRSLALAGAAATSCIGAEVGFAQGPSPIGERAGDLDLDSVKGNAGRPQLVGDLGPEQGRNALHLQATLYDVGLWLGEGHVDGLVGRLVAASPETLRGAFGRGQLAVLGRVRLARALL